MLLLLHGSRAVLSASSSQQPSAKSFFATSRVFDESTKSSMSTIFKEAANGVDHVVLLKVASDIETSLVESMIHRVSGLTAISGVQSVTVGPIVVDPSFMEDRRRGYSHYIRVRLDSMEALKDYQDDPLHRSCVQEAIVPILDGPPLAVDCINDIVYSE
jgi:hypothetical protein